MENDCLVHHGILGMKWGVRRYQNEDGSLTPAGQKRLAKIEAKKTKLLGEGNKADKPSNTQPKIEKTSKKKSLEDMTDEELDRAIKRKKMEKDYLNTDKDVKDLLPKPKQSRLKRFAGDAWDNAIAPAIIESGKTTLKNFLDKKGKELLGPETKSELEKLKEEFEKSDYIRKIKQNKFDTDNIGKPKSKSEAEEWKEKADISKNKRTVASNDDWFEERAKKKNKKEEKASSQEPKKEPVESVEAEFYDDPRRESRNRTQNDSTKRDNDFTIILGDDLWRDVSSSSYNSPNNAQRLKAGKTFVAGLLT